MRPPRFHLRTLLIAVAVAAIVIGIITENPVRRRERLREVASYHYRMKGGPWAVSLDSPEAWAERARQTRLAQRLRPERRVWHGH
jgi:hypothetical protein